MHHFYIHNFYHATSIYIFINMFFVFTYSFSVEVKPRFHAVFQDGKMVMDDEDEENGEKEESSGEENLEDGEEDSEGSENEVEDEDVSEEEDEDVSDEEDDKNADEEEDNEGLTYITLLPVIPHFSVLKYWI